MISIHAPIVGCDEVCICYVEDMFKISIHAPIVGCDLTAQQLSAQNLKFQSTHPSWGATHYWCFLSFKRTISIHAPIVGCDSCTRRISSRIKNFNPRTHRGVRRDGSFEDIKPLLISIHAPIVGCDRGASYSSLLEVLFQSTHPSWGATFASLSWMQKSI